MNSELARLYALIDDVEIAMMTTRRPDGHLESRAMATQRQAPGADLWFVSAEGTAKLRDLEHDPHVNLGYCNSHTRAWASVAGTAVVSRRREKIHELYTPDWKPWFPEEGDPRHGTSDDPRIVLIGVHIHTAVFLESDQPRPLVLYDTANRWLTGEMAQLGELRTVKR
jgi:general stress protein 26